MPTVEGMLCRNENSKNVARQIQHLVYVLEYISEIADQTGKSQRTHIIEMHFSLALAPLRFVTCKLIPVGVANAAIVINVRAVGLIWILLE